VGKCSDKKGVRSRGNEITGTVNRNKLLFIDIYKLRRGEQLTEDNN